MSLYEAVVALVGTPPAGYDIIAWMACVIVLLYLVCSAFSIVASVISYIGGR